MKDEKKPMFLRKPSGFDFTLLNNTLVMYIVMIEAKSPIAIA